jgi:hypothetical protein
MVPSFSVELYIGGICGTPVGTTVIGRKEKNSVTGIS